MVPGATAAQAINEANRILRVVGARGAVVTVDPAVLRPDTRRLTVNVNIPLDRNGLITPTFTRGKNLSSSSTLRTERAENR
jgi:hypothetical protein